MNGGLTSLSEGDFLLNHRVALLIAIAGLLSMASCTETDASPQTTLRGRVFAADDGRPVEMATVALTNGKSTMTDAKGRYQLSAEKGGGQVEASGEGFAPVTRGAPKGDGYVELFPKKYDAVETVDVKSGGAIAVKGTKVEFEPDSFRTKAGAKPETAEVRVAVPKTSSPTEISSLPGEFKAKSSGNKGQIAVESPIFVDAASPKDNEPLELDKTKGAHVTFPAPRGAEKEEPELFKYNEKEDVWESRGKATRTKNKQEMPGYEADIDELGWWSTGIFIDTLTCVRGCVKTPSGEPALRATVAAKGITLTTQSFAYTDDRGCFAMNVPANAEVLVSAQTEGALAGPTRVMTGISGPSVEEDPGACVSVKELRLVELTESACALGLSACGDRCVDLTRDSEHCGGCNERCADGASCVDGTCELAVVCEAGFVASGGDCVDIDECQSDNGGCAQTCNNGEGTFSCACDRGYVLDEDGRGCTFDATCMMLGCGTNAHCDAIDGSMGCVCDAGFSGDGMTCTDTNECLVNNGGCDGLTACLNTEGSRSCGACPSGYSGDGSTGCKDIDECSAQPSPCGSHSTCTNNTGAPPTCACLKGFSDIDETSTLRCAWTDPRLQNLTLSAGALTPQFNPNQTTYSAVVPASVTSVTLTPVLPQGAVATILINGAETLQGVASSPIALGFGTNSIQVVVTAESGATSSYAIAVSRSHQERASFLGARGSQPELGHSVAISADGLTVAVGAPGDGSNVPGDAADDGAPRSGAVYLYVFSAGQWTLERYLKPNDIVAGAEFGRAVALSGNGNVLTVGAPGAAQSTVQGAAYTFTRAGTTWTQSIKVASTPSPQGFGEAVSVSGDGSTFAVSDAAGGALVYVRGAGDWTQQTRVVPLVSDANDAFGASLWLSSDGNTLAVGAPLEDSASTSDLTSNSLADSGIVYLFRRVNAVWTQITAMKAPSPGAGDQFGTQVRLSSDAFVLVASAPYEDSGATGVDGNPEDESALDSGAVYVFRDFTEAWVSDAYLKPPTANPEIHFGMSLALTGDGYRVQVGSLRDPNGEGAIDTFENGDGWLTRPQRTWDWPLSGERYGFALAAAGDVTRFVVGVPGHSDAATGINSFEGPADGLAPNSGLAVIYQDDGEVISREIAAKPSSVDADTGLAHAIAISADGSTVAVGAPSEDSATKGISTGIVNGEGALESGAVLVYRRGTNAFTLEASIKASNADPYDQFGTSVALSADGSILAVGAPGEDSARTGVLTTLPPDDNQGSDLGAVYLFTRAGSAWTESRYFKPAADAGADMFGSSVALSSDGNTLVVGAPLEDGPGEDLPDTGAVYHFANGQNGWAEATPMFHASNADQNQYFGASLALSVDGSTLAVGAPYESSNATGINETANTSSPGAGAAYVFLRGSNGFYTQQAYVKASNTQVFSEIDGDNFGTSIALSSDGNTLVVGAPYEDSDSDQNQTSEEAQDSGAAYRFLRSGATWTQSAYVKGPSIKAGALFGKSVAVNADASITVVGVPFFSDTTGAVFVLLPTPTAPEIFVGRDPPQGLYGRFVAMSASGLSFVVAEATYNGGPGAVWVYE